MSDSESEISAAESSFEDSAHEQEQTSKKKSSKRTSSSSSKSKKSGKTSTRTRKVDESKFKSAAMIEDSDIDEDYEVDENGHVKLIGGSTSSAKAPNEREDDSDSPRPAKKKRKVVPSASTSKSKENVKPRRVSSEKKECKPVKDDSSSEGESAPPPKSNSKTKEKAAAPKRKSKKAELSKDEETIKQLKSFVVACGVRKVWSKEFKDIEDSPSSQIRRLRQILSGLGMNGRMSLAKAKEIKEKRDMAQELEDVQTFHENIVSGPRKRIARGGKQPDEQNDESDESGSEDDSGPPQKKAKNAHQSIMAFLGDQSDDD